MDILSQANQMMGSVTEYYQRKNALLARAVEMDRLGHPEAAEALRKEYRTKFGAPEQAAETYRKTGSEEEAKKVYIEFMVKGGDITSEDMAKGFDGITASTLAAQTPQDLDPQIQSILWNENAIDIGSFMKLAPRVPAMQLKFQYVMETSSGMGGTGGSASEVALGNSMIPGTQLLNVHLKHKKVVSTLGRVAEQINTLPWVNGGEYPDARNVQNLMRMRQQGIYWDSSDSQRDGVSGLVADGLIELIQKTTSGRMNDDNGNPMPESSFNYQNRFGHTIDLLGQELNDDTEIREGADLLGSRWFANANTILMPRELISQIEKQQKTGRRFANVLDPMFVGSSFVGFVIGGQFMRVVPDADLSPLSIDNWFGLYTTNRPIGYPTGTPTVSVTAQTEGATDGLTYGLWDSNPMGADTVYYLATYVDEYDRESLGTISSGTAIAVGQEAKIDISGVPSSATRIRLYRAQSGSGYGVTATDACWIADIKPSSSGATVTYIDHNVRRPYTGTAIAMHIEGASDPLGYNDPEVTWRSLVRKAGLEGISLFEDYNRVMNRPNTTGIAVLGPDVVAKDIPLAQDVARARLYASTSAPFVRNPYGCYILSNIALRG